MISRLAVAFFVTVVVGGTVLGQPIPGERMSHSADSENVDDPGSVVCTIFFPWPEEGWMRGYEAEDFGITADYEIVSITGGPPGLG